MHTAYRRLTSLTALIFTATALQACGNNTARSTGSEHIRGTIRSLDDDVLTVTTANGSVRVQLAEPIKVATAVESDRAHIADGSFLGIAWAMQPDGSKRAAEVTVFPESMRGTGEGSYGWDHPGADGGGKMTNGTASSSKMTNGTVSTSKMTNGTVSTSKMTNGTVSTQADGSSLTLQYKDGSSDSSQTITLPADIPIVALEPGEKADLQPGAHVFVVANRDPKGLLTAARVIAGKNGVVPPM